MLQTYWLKFRSLKWYWQLAAVVLVVLIINSCSGAVSGPTIPGVPLPDAR